MRGVLLVLLLLAGAARGEDRAAFGFSQHPGAPVPFDEAFTGEDGARTTLRTLAANRPVLLVLGYFHCPNLCGIVRDDVFSALARSTLDPGRYTVAVVSIDPSETVADAAGAKAAVLDRYPSAANARFLVGPAGAVEEAVGFRARRDTADGQFLHPAGLVVLTPGGTVSGYLLGVGYAPQTIERLLQTAAGGVVAAAASPILLLCFHYDPVTGRYSLAITKVLRAAAVLTTLGLLAGLGWAHRHSIGRSA